MGAPSNEELDNEGYVLLDRSGYGTGVIIGVGAQDQAEARKIQHELQRQFPGIKFGILGGVTGVASFKFVPAGRERVRTLPPSHESNGPSEMGEEDLGDLLGATPPTMTP